MSGGGGLLRLARSYLLTPRVALVSAALVPLEVAANVLCPWIAFLTVQMLIERQGDPPASLYRAVLLRVAIMVGLVLVQYCARFVLSRLYQGAVFTGCARLRTDLYAALQGESSATDAHRRVGELLARLVADVQTLQDSVLDIITDVPCDALALLGISMLMLWQSPVLGAVVVGFFALVAAGGLALARRGWRSHEATMEGLGSLSARYQEALSAGRTLHTLGAARGEAKGLAEASRTFARAQEETGWVQAVVVPFATLCEYGGLMLALLVGCWLAVHGRLAPVAIMMYLGYVEIMAEPIERTGRVLPRLQKAAAAGRRLAAALAGGAAAAAGGLAPGRAGAISARALTFRYPGAARDALSALDFDIPAGARVAIIGGNGAGKSTLCDLMLGLNAPASGTLTIDGVPLSAIDREAWRRAIGVVPQEVVLLNRSIAENIVLGAEVAGAEEQTAARAAALAGLESCIAGLPQGILTPVGERGAALSGGQRQRLAIARLFARDPAVVLLDEPTSALDAGAERELIPVIDRLCRGRTTLLISHRMPLLERAEHVLLLDQGRLVASGPPRDIWRDQPRYRGLLPATWGADAPAGASAGATPGGGST